MIIEFRDLKVPRTLNESELRIIRDKTTNLIIGKFSYKRISDSEIQIEYIYIDEFRQRKGYGSETLAYICEWADKEKFILSLIAQPVHQHNKIIVPLSPDEKNYHDTQKYLVKYCRKFGFKSLSSENEIKHRMKRINQ